MRMVVAVDVQDGGGKVLIAAMRFAERFDATIDLAFASEWSPARLPVAKDPTEPQQALREKWQQHADEELAQLEGLFAHVPEARRGRIRFLPGRRTEVLPPLTDEYDMTVVGTHARRGLARVLLGSVTARLLPEARGPVLVVGLDDALPELHEPLRVGVPVDERDSRGLAYVAGYMPHADVRIAHVVPPGAWSPLLWAGEEHVPMGVEERVDKLAELLEAQGEKMALTQHRAVVLTGETSNPGDTVSEWAHNAELDLVVVPTRSRDDLSRLVMGSVALRVAEKAPCAVLVVPP